MANMTKQDTAEKKGGGQVKDALIPTEYRHHTGTKPIVGPNGGAVGWTYTINNITSGSTSPSVGTADNAYVVTVSGKRGTRVQGVFYGQERAETFADLLQENLDVVLGDGVCTVSIQDVPLNTDPDYNKPTKSSDNTSVTSTPVKASNVYISAPGGKLADDIDLTPLIEGARLRS